MSNETNESAGGELSTWINQQPVHTQSVLTELSNQLTLDLVARAKKVMGRRRSSTMTDSDLEEAFEEMTRPPHLYGGHAVPRDRRIVGQVATLVGAAMFTQWELHWVVSVLGFGIAGLGIYIREHQEPSRVTVLPESPASTDAVA